MSDYVFQVGEGGMQPSRPMCARATAAQLLAGCLRLCVLAPVLCMLAPPMSLSGSAAAEARNPAAAAQKLMQAGCVEHLDCRCNIIVA